MLSSKPIPDIGGGAVWNSIRYYWERYLFWTVVVVLAVGVIRWDWHLTVWEWLGEANGEESNSTTVRNFGLIFMSIVAIQLTWRRIKIAAREARTSRENLQNARDALNLNYKTLDYTAQRDEKDRKLDQYARASERLGSDGVSARLGAIYELRDLTEQDLEQFHVRTMRMLCAFVRFPPAETDGGVLSNTDLCDQPLRADVQAAMEVIGSRTEKHVQLESDAGYIPDLRQASLVRLELRSGNLSEIDFRGSRFWGSDLMNADLSRSELQYTDFRSPWVVRGQDFAEITSQEGSFTQRGNAIMNSLTRLIGVDMTGASMLQANLSGADLQGTRLGGANLPEVNLAGAFLYGVDLAESEMVGSNLTGAFLPGAKLNGAGLLNANLSGTDLSGSDGPKSTAKHPPEGLTQAQLDQACSDPENPPKLDESSGLVWHGRSCR
jgi:uncharacterized protein YjbI with pentapeptide repeats